MKSRARVLTDSQRNNCMVQNRVEPEIVHETACAAFVALKFRRYRLASCSMSLTVLAVANPFVAFR